MTNAKTITDPNKVPFLVSEEELRKLYMDKKMSMGDVAKSLSCSRQRVSRWLSFWEIPKRTAGQQTAIVFSGREHGPNWRGGRWFVKHSRTWFVYAPNHPRCKHNGGVEEHRLHAEDRIGRYLTSKEVVHHLDQDRNNNSQGNLCVMSRGNHTWLHCLLGSVGVRMISNGKIETVLSVLNENEKALVEKVYHERLAIIE